MQSTRYHYPNGRWVAQMVAMAAKKEVSSLQKLIQESNAEVRQLQKQLADMERDSHTETVKMRLEVQNSTLAYVLLMHTQYDAKLLKLQKQNTSRTQSSTAASSSVNNEIFRKVPRVKNMV